MKKKYSTKYVFNKDGNLLPIEDRTFITKEGYDLTVVGGGEKTGFITINIGTYTAEVSVDSVKKGSVKNPYHPSEQDTGYLGEGVYKPWKNGKSTKVYRTWRSMLKRAYSEKSNNSNPTYKDVTVHEEWHNFQVFAAWFETSNYQDGWELDKDLVSVGTKVYSQDTCLFVPSALNKFMANTQLNNTSGYTGVSYIKDSNSWKAYIICMEAGKLISLGYYNTAEEASEVYLKKRVNNCTIWKEQMKGILPEAALSNLK